MIRTTVFACVLFALSSSACGAELSDAGRSVQVGKADPRGACRELGAVYGSGGGGAYTSTEDKMRSARNEIRNNAAALGANYVELDALGSDVMGMTMTGRAFACDNIPSTEAEPAVVAPPAPSTAPTPEERLAKLKELLDKGLITQDEYDKRRAQILQSI
jgi:hypothetical protein